MKLCTEALPKYFTIATSNNSHYSRTTNCFDFVDNNSNILVVAVGDSWTYGSDLDVKTRVREIYGSLIAQTLDADLLNLGQAGSNNFFIAERVEELGKIIPSLNYKHIYLICTFTEIGRSFNSHHDVYIDYLEWFRHNDISNFLAFLNQECYNRIYKVSQQHNITLRIGTNFIDPIGFRADVEPWFRQLGIDCEIISHAGHTGVSRLHAVNQFLENKKDFKNWFNNLVDLSKYTDQVCKSPILINAHPTAQGHQIWANSLLKTIK